MTFTTRNNARAQVAAAIEGNGRDIARREEYDIEAIIGATFGFDPRRGYVQTATEEDFWKAVERHEKGPQAEA